MNGEVIEVSAVTRRKLTLLFYSDTTTANDKIISGKLL
jgi:hypothetical protein